MTYSEDQYISFEDCINHPVISDSVFSQSGERTFKNWV